jgi:hypothetical protein
MEPDKQ